VRQSIFAFCNYSIDAPLAAILPDGRQVVVQVRHDLEAIMMAELAASWPQVPGISVSHRASVSAVSCTMTPPRCSSCVRRDDHGQGTH